MSKKSKQKRKAERNARELQTPASMDGGSGSEAESFQQAPKLKGKTIDRDEKLEYPKNRSESPQAESSRSQNLRRKDKTIDQKTRFARSPTRAGDFAPNASDHDSNEESDLDMLGDVSEEPVIEDRPAPLTGWVKDTIKSETSKWSERMVEEFFTAQPPGYEECQNFFRRLNQKIRGANQQNNVVNLDAGTIPETSYNALCEAWQQTAANTTNAEESWAAFNKTRDLLNQFNKRHYLPQAWNISEAWAEGQIGTPNPRTGEEDITSTSDGASQPDPANKVLSSEESSGEPGSESESEADRSEPIGLDALEERTIKKQRRLTTARVLYWWPKGTGSQIFVRYGDKSAPIFRIRSGSHESYNPGKVERVLTKTRGTAKFTVIKDGLVEEFWKYTRKNVKDIIAIGWKIEDDDEEGINPLNLLQPTKGAIFPQTRVLVEWKDGRCTLEGRSFIRRITTGSALDGDRVIYQKAEELEIRYREKHGLEVFDEDYDYDDEDEESDYIRPRRADRRYRSEPTRYPRRVKPSTRSRFFSSEDSDESDTSIQSYNTRRRRHRSEPTHYSTTRRKTPPEKEISSTVKINQLERELRRLKMESSRSPPKRRDRRERTA